MRTILITIASIFIFTVNGHTFHPLKMAVVDMIYKDNKIYLKLKLFADDFGLELSDFCKSRVEFNQQSIPKEALPCIQKYVSQNFICLINNSELRFNLKKAKVEEGDIGIRMVMIEFESPILAKELFKSMKVKCTLLFGFMSTQNNILNIDLFSGKNTRTIHFENSEGPVMKEVFF